MQIAEGSCRASPNCWRSFSTGGVITPRFSATIGRPAEGILQSRKKIFTRTFDPAAVDRGGFSAGNLPVGFESAKVIEAHHVKQRERGAKALDPPFVSARG